jgi:glyoxylase-like metal-dependent hydrolase (beta-lactamase superfamily II)
MADPTPQTPSPAAGGSFTVHPAAENVWRIEQSGPIDVGVNAYLVAGRERAVLIDTGFGGGDLAGCVRGIADLPLAVVNTHFHEDHAGGNPQFPAIHIHRLDLEAARPLSAGCELVPIAEGLILDLGGRKLEVIEAPGHTRGSIVLLDSAASLLFAGDNNNPIVWLFLAECLPLEAYLRNLERLEGRSGEFETVLPGHGAPLDKAFFREQMTCAQMIIGGECQGEKYDSLAGTGILCKYKRAGIAFDPENIFL